MDSRTKESWKDKEIKKLILKRITRKKVRQLTQGVFSTLFNVTLYLLSLPVLSLGKTPTSRGVYQMFRDADELLEEINYEKFMQSLQVLRKNGLIESLKDWNEEPIITSIGWKKLKSLTPIYDSERLWNGKLYLISYDFPKKLNFARDLFRQYIKKLGAFKLQGSLYLTFNNPYDFIEEFQKTHQFFGTILISELSKKGFVGKNDLKTFLWEVANLEEINYRYRQFIDNYQKEKIVSLFQISLEYYSILKDDLQLPFKLLPDEYLGDDAHLLFSKFLK